MENVHVVICQEGIQSANTLNDPILVRGTVPSLDIAILGSSRSTPVSIGLQFNIVETSWASEADHSQHVVQPASASASVLSPPALPTVMEL